MAPNNGTRPPIDHQQKATHGPFPLQILVTSKSRLVFIEQFAESVQFTPKNDALGVSELIQCKPIQNATSSSVPHELRSGASSLVLDQSSTALDPVNNETRYSEDVSTDQEKKTSEY